MIQTAESQNPPDLDAVIAAFRSTSSLREYTPLRELISTVDGLVLQFNTVLPQALSDQVSWYRQDLARRLELATQAPVTEDDLGHYRSGWEKLNNVICHTLAEQQARLNAEEQVAALQIENQQVVEEGIYDALSWGTEDARKGLLTKKAGREIATKFTKTHATSFLERELALLDGAHANGFGTIILDADYFGQVNGRHGHRRGDYVLMQIAKIIYSLFSPEHRGDLIIRFGGEEDLVLVSNISKADLITKAGSLRRAIASLQLAVELEDLENEAYLRANPYELYVTERTLKRKDLSPLYLGIEQEKGIIRDARRVTASLGVIHSDDVRDLISELSGNLPALYDNLVQRADNLLYAAKAHGRNAFAFVHSRPQ